MNEAKLVILVDSLIRKAIADLESRSTLQGPRGLRGPAGADGNDFNLEDHKEVLLDLIRQNVPDKIELTDEQREELRGVDGKDGKDGHSFNFEQERENIAALVNSYVLEIQEGLKLKFSDLTEEEKETLRGPRGRDGKAFSWEDHSEAISEIVTNYVSSISESFKLRFSDLTEDDLAQLRGPRGQRGKQGKDFAFDEHREVIAAILQDYVDSIRSALAFKFEDFTPDQLDGLKLKFEQLTEEERLSLKGARGQRGKQGIQGDQGFSAYEVAKAAGFTGSIAEWLESLRGIAGPRGPIGPQGLQGPRGLSGAPGSQGLAGRDAPRISDFEIVDKGDDEIALRIELSDGSGYETSPVKLPSKLVNQYNTYVSGRSGGGVAPSNTEYFDEGVSLGTTEKINFVGDGISATVVGDEIQVRVDIPDPTPALEVLDEGVSLGTPSKIDFVGDNVTATLDGDTVRVQVSGTPGSADIEILDEGVQVVSTASSINFIGPYVRVRQRTTMDQWDPLSAVEPSLVDYATPGNDKVDVYIDITDPSIILDVPCESDVFVGAFVRMNSLGVAVNAIASTYATSNVLGLVEVKPTPETCTVRISGRSAPVYSGLDPALDYFLSDTAPGMMSSLVPVAPGTVKLKLGQAFSGSSFVLAKGERLERS